MKKRFFIITALLLLTIPVLSGCNDMYSDYEAMQAIDDFLEGFLEEGEEVLEGDIVEDGVTLLLTHPAGRSPNVFTTGWVFGARCSYEGKDYSGSVKWSGLVSHRRKAQCHGLPSVEQAETRLCSLLLLTISSIPKHSA